MPILHTYIIITHIYTSALQPSERQLFTLFNLSIYVFRNYYNYDN